MAIRLFVRDDSGEPAAYFGEPGNIDESVLGQHIHELIKNAVATGDNYVEVSFELTEMTDQQVAELPDM